MTYTSVVIDDLDGLGTRLLPSKADAPLIVDADTVLPSSFSRKGLESIPWRHLEIIEPGCNLQLPKLSPGNRLDVHKPPDPLAPAKSLRIRATERPDHRK
jgi:hypothetical protein